MTKAKIQIGDRVAYSASFLRSTGQTVGEASFQRATVTALENLGSIVLAVMAWDNPEWIISRVNVGNLAKVGTAAMNTQ